MYVDLLSAAMSGERDTPKTREGLLSVVKSCRGRMLDARSQNARPAEGRLACEVQYDRALIDLCLALGIDADPEQFAQPAGERVRLERAIMVSGEDLGGAGRGERSPPD